jgi:phage shock protein PspC (stress-responsive transcriptional regulator)
MKRVEIIHIGGIAFSIDDDAYKSLVAYMDALDNYFKNEQGGKEVIADIENRIAELFAARPGGEKAIITLREVEQVIVTLGTVEDITGSKPDTGEESPPPKSERQSRRLYRDLDARYVGGVCAGIANWTGIRVLVVRLLFIIPALWSLSWHVCILTGLVYILACLVIPVANTTARKLEMRGEPVNISNIEKSVKEPVTRSLVSRFFSEARWLIGQCFKILFRIIRIGIGLCLLAAGLVILETAVCAVFMREFLSPEIIEREVFAFYEILQYVITPLSRIILYTCGAIIVLLLASACFYWGTWLTVKFKITRRIVHVVLSVTWVGAVLLVLLIHFAEGRLHAREGKAMETITIPLADTLYVNALPDTLQFSNNSQNIYHDKKNERFLGRPRLYFHRVDDEKEIKIVVNKYAYSTHSLRAQQLAGEIDYRGVTARDSIFLSPYFTVTPPGEWHFQSVNLTLHIPSETIVILDESCKPLVGSWIITSKWGRREPYWGKGVITNWKDK